MKRVFAVMRYALVFLCNLVLLFLFHSYLNVLLFAALCLLPVCSFLMLHHAAGQIHATLTLPPGPLSRTEPLFLRIALRNPTLFPIPTVRICLHFENLFYETNGSHQLVLPARARQETSATYPLLSERSGTLQVGITSIVLRDYLGFFEKKLSTTALETCVLFPAETLAEHSADPVFREDTSDDTHTIRSYVESTEVTGIREYIPGDKLQNIHWKLSAKQDALLVKEKNGTATNELHLLLELPKEEPERAEQILEKLFHTTEVLTRQMIPYTLWFYQGGTLQAAAIEHNAQRLSCLEHLLLEPRFSRKGEVAKLFRHMNGPNAHVLYFGCENTKENNNNIL